MVADFKVISVIVNGVREEGVIANKAGKEKGNVLIKE